MSPGSIALVLLALAASPVCAQGPPPASSLLDRAAERALAYDASALQWTCDELVRRVHYNGNGNPTRESVKSYALLMVVDPEDHLPIELTAPSSSGGRGSERPPAGATGFPAVTSWLRLFHPDSRPWLLIRDVGGDGAPSAQGHPFAFRGAVTFDDGSDLREWEGTAWVDPDTGDLMRVEAAPSSQPERLAVLVDRRNKWGIPINLFGLSFSIGPTAHGRHVDVSFGLYETGFWLPTTARLETFDAVTKHSQRPLRATLVSLRQCRRFEAEAASDERSRTDALRTKKP